MVDVVCLDSVRRERIQVCDLTLWFLHGARKSNQIRTAARNPALSESQSLTEIDGEIH